MILAWCMAAVHAEVPLPTLRVALARDRWHEVNAILESGCAFQRLASVMICAEGTTDAAIAHADAFQEALYYDAGLQYLVGLAERYAGNDSAAQGRYERALLLDRTYDAAWYDLGEIYIKRGQYAKATEAFSMVASLVSTGPNAWLGPWRLAEIAALEHDAPRFEAQIKIAMELGFSFQQIAGLPNWKRFYADPALQDTLDKMLTVYAAPDVVESLKAD